MRWEFGFGSLAALGIVWVLIYGGTGSSALANLVCGVLVAIALIVTLAPGLFTPKPPVKQAGKPAETENYVEPEALSEEQRRMMSGQG